MKQIAAAIIAFAAVALGTKLYAAEPGRGLTATFEQDYLKSIIDHHYSALRMTELAAGTDITRDAPISSNEGTSPTPEEPATQGKASLQQIRSLARTNNRMQREEILEAQAFLRDWYGIEYDPTLRQAERRRSTFLRTPPVATPST